MANAQHGVQVILPCLNEVQALPWVLGRMPHGYRPIVVDNGSTDGSAEHAERLGATVVRAPVRGYGAACQAGLRAADADVVAVMDCDASLDPAQLPDLVAPVAAGELDLAVGRRRPTSRQAFPYLLRLANWEVARLVRARTGVALAEIGPMRVAPRRGLLELGLSEPHAGYPVETVLRAAEAGWRVGQIDVAYRPRAGRSKVTGTPRGALRAVRDIRSVLARSPAAVR